MLWFSWTVHLQVDFATFISIRAEHAAVVRTGALDEAWHCAAGLLHDLEHMIEMDMMCFFTTDKLSVVNKFILLDLICFIQGALPCSNHSHAPRDHTL